MLEITKKQSEFGYYFIISTNEGKFEISFQDNLNLCWKNLYQGSIIEQPESKFFTITKENYYLYLLFEELYTDVKDCNVFRIDEFDVFGCKNVKDVKKLHLEKAKLNNNLKKQEQYNPERLFHDGIIEWHCDNFPYQEASVVKIKKEEDIFIVDFQKSKNIDRHLTYSVRFRNSGSRYDPFNFIFMRMYNKLIDYEPDLHKTHIEKDSWQKKLKKNK